MELSFPNRGQRMMALMRKPLSALDPEQMDRLKQNLAQAKPSLAVTALRRLLSRRPRLGTGLFQRRGDGVVDPLEPDELAARCAPPRGCPRSPCGCAPAA